MGNLFAASPMGMYRLIQVLTYLVCSYFIVFKLLSRPQERQPKATSSALFVGTTVLLAGFFI